MSDASTLAIGFDPTPASAVMVTVEGMENTGVEVTGGGAGAGAGAGAGVGDGELPPAPPPPHALSRTSPGRKSAILGMLTNPVAGI